MYYVRRALMHLLVWLTAAATLLAGTPHVQCRCPDGTFKPVCFAPVGMETCCCCSESGEPEETPPSCCQETMKQQQTPQGPTFGHDGCQRILVEPSPVTSERTDAPTQQAVAVAIASVACFQAVTIPEPATNPMSSASVLPSLDLQLVLQHFVI
jgi:hypothetical protein